MGSGEAVGCFLFGGRRHVLENSLDLFDLFLAFYLLLCYFIYSQ